MPRPLPAALLTRAAAVLGALGFDDVERGTDAETGEPYLAVTDDTGASVVVTVSDLGLVLHDTLPLAPALASDAVAAFVAGANATAAVARIAADADGTMLHADALYAGAFDPRAFERLADAFLGDTDALWEDADALGLLAPTPPEDADEAAGGAPPPAPAPVPDRPRGGRLTAGRA